MFGRRRRVAPVMQVPLPDLSNEQVFELLSAKLAEIVGARGQWTLVPRSSDDTDVIFHDLKADQIAATLTDLLSAKKAALRGEVAAEPTALTFAPAPIAVWAEPEGATVAAPVQLPSREDEYAELTRLVA